jgi:ribosomal protein S18 acetylase RimI-like enzyme
MATSLDVPRRSNRDLSVREEVEAVCRLLRRAYAVDPAWNAWSVVRFDVWSHHRFADAALRGDTSWQKRIALWEADGDVAAAALLHAEGPGDAVAVGLPSVAVEDEQLAWLEERYDSAPCTAPLVVELAGNRRLRAALAGRGYVALQGHWIARERRLEPSEHDDVQVPPRYRVKSVETPAEVLAYHVAVGSVFGRAGPEAIAEYQFRASTPSYVPELCVIAVDDRGEVGAFATAWLDRANNVAELEPVGTVAAHRRRHLAAAVVAEACNRPRNLGCPLATVHSWSEAEAANGFYRAAGFEATRAVYNWRRS